MALRLLTATKRIFVEEYLADLNPKHLGLYVAVKREISFADETEAAFRDAIQKIIKRVF